MKKKVLMKPQKAWATVTESGWLTTVHCDKRRITKFGTERLARVESREVRRKK